MRMKWMVFVLSLSALFGIPAQAALILNVTLDYDQERDHAMTNGVVNELARHLEGSLGQAVKLIMTQNAERVGERVRTAQYDAVLAPAHIIGLAMRHHYTPVARTSSNAQTLLVSRPDIQLKGVAQARGRSLVLPHPESLVSYMMRGELNALGASPASYFGQVRYVNRYASALYALDIGQFELAAVKGDVLRQWDAKGGKARVVQMLAETPLGGLAVRDSLDGHVKERIVQALLTLPAPLQAQLAKIGLGGGFVAATAKDFEYVSQRGYFTPEVLPGATIVTAREVAELMAKGVPLFDVRPPAHYRQGHIPKAINVPYELNSLKEPDADLSMDKFDLSKLPQDKNSPLIVQCNGAECWYSYKAAKYLVGKGYKQIYWFRTGLPAWREAGYAVEQGT